jgi:hypothetical protein
MGIEPQGREKGQKLLQDLPLRLPIPNDAALSEARPSRLKLGLDEAHDLTFRGKHARDGGEYKAQGDKGDVHGN